MGGRGEIRLGGGSGRRYRHTRIGGNEFGAAGEREEIYGKERRWVFRSFDTTIAPTFTCFFSPRRRRTYHIHTFTILNYIFVLPCVPRTPLHPPPPKTKKTFPSNSDVPPRWSPYPPSRVAREGVCLPALQLLLLQPGDGSVPVGPAGGRGRGEGPKRRRERHGRRGFQRRQEDFL